MNARGGNQILEMGKLDRVGYSSIGNTAPRVAIRAAFRSARFEIIFAVVTSGTNLLSVLTRIDRRFQIVSGEVKFNAKPTLSQVKGFFLEPRHSMTLHGLVIG